MKFYVRGGIGDFLQSSWFIKNNSNQQFIVHTHFDGAELFFKNLGVKNVSFYHFKNTEEHDAQADKILVDHGENSTTNIKECPRSFYSSVDLFDDFEAEAKDFVKKFSEVKQIIGIHPFGSSFSSNVYTKFNLPVKFIPSEIVKNIINPDFNYIIFGKKEELDSYGIEESGNILHTNLSIEGCLELVKRCYKFIGTDSGFKTMSSMRRIPTFCTLGDFEDYLRDSLFINQYEKDGVMQVFKYTDLSEKHEALLDSLNLFLQEQ